MFPIGWTSMKMAFDTTSCLLVGKRIVVPRLLLLARWF
jgi:hypothetical protein